MKCPVCKTECHELNACPECGFDDLSPTFLSKEDGESWLQNVVTPWRQAYWESFDDFEIEDCELIEYYGESTVVIIPYGIEHISKDAFKFNKSIREVYFPDTLKTIGSWAFYASNLQFANLPNGIEYIGERAFSSTDLRSITIPSTCRKICEEAFTACFDLCSATIMRGVEEIEKEAFSWCSNLKSVMIPDTVRTIGAGAFSSGCGEMHIAVDPRNETYTVKNNTLIDRKKGEIISGVLSNAIPADSDISVIGAYAYQSSDCGSGVLAIPPNIVSIEDYAFCASKVRKAYIPRTVKRMGSSLFLLAEDCTIFCEMKGATPQWAYDWCEAKRSQISWGQKWKQRAGTPELLLLDKIKYTVTITSYSYDENEDQLKMQLRLTNRSDTTVRFVVSKLALDDDPCKFTHWGTVAPNNETLCNFTYDDNEFASILISNAEEISLGITVKDDDDQYVFAKGETVTLPGFYIPNPDEEDDDQLPF